MKDMKKQSFEQIVLEFIKKQEEHNKKQEEHNKKVDERLGFLESLHREEINKNK